jgi:uncharacterized protein YlaI
MKTQQEIHKLSCPVCMRGHLNHDHNVPTKITKDGWVKQYVCHLCEQRVNVKIEKVKKGKKNV